MHINNARFNRIARVSIALLALLTIPVRGFAGSKQSSQGIIHFRTEADVTGDRIADTVVLVGYESELGGPFCSSHEVVVTDGATKEETLLALGDRGAGYPGSLLLGDINGDGASEIIVSIPTGGSGGITNFFIASAADGNVRLMVDPEKIAHGPELATSSLDHYTIEVMDEVRNSRTLLGLSKPDQPGESDPYDEYYSESGALLRPIDIWVDPVSGAELAPADEKGGPQQFITYQKIWAIYHANSVGIVRTAWKYLDGELAIASVDVIPYLDPDAYATYLKSIDSSDPARAVKQAISDYKARFHNAPPAFREHAFAAFRQFHLGIARREGESLERIAGIRDARSSDEILAAYARLPQIAKDRKASHTFRDAGLTTVYAGEGMWTVEPRTGFYSKQFGAMLPTSVLTFLELDEVERNKPWLADGALVVSIKELGRRTAEWEAYVENNPNSLFLGEAKLRFNQALGGLLLGTNNTPHYDSATGLVRDEALRALSSHAEAYPNTRSGKAAGEIVQILKKTPDAQDDAVRRKIKRVVEDAMYADERA
ncbi:MAG: hypothetical protein PHP20_06825 [Firmicutes bacterium]|nr:hypothetical protein [Bacillota bacterium]MDD4792764.1 hypothetical protein [Bacillota bacterium]